MRAALNPLWVAQQQIIPPITAADLPPAVPVYIYESQGTYPLRASVTPDQAQTVIWAGPDPPPIGSGYAVNPVDFWVPTP